MKVFVGDLDEAGAGFVEEIAGEEEAVAEIGEVGVDAEFPGVAEGTDHFGFLGEVFVLAVLDVATIDEGLEIGAVPDAVGRVNVDHLYLASHAFFFEEGVHDEERIAGDEAIGPSVGVAVEVHGFAEGRIFLAGFEEVALGGLERTPLRLRTASMMVRGSMRSWTWRETVGTSKEVCSFLPAQTS
jgi:hypothetical protein